MTDLNRSRVWRVGCHPYECSYQLVYHAGWLTTLPAQVITAQCSSQLPMTIITMHGNECDDRLFLMDWPQSPVSFPQSLAMNECCFDICTTQAGREAKSGH